MHSSVKMTSLNCSSSSKHLFTQTTLFSLLASLIAWQYLGVVKVQPSSLRALAIVLLLYVTFSSPNVSASSFFKSPAWNHGYDRLKEEQLLAIEKFMTGSDVFVSLPTGFGKLLI